MKVSLQSQICSTLSFVIIIFIHIYIYSKSFEIIHFATNSKKSASLYSLYYYSDTALNSFQITRNNLFCDKHRNISISTNINVIELKSTRRIYQIK